ncbi:MAG: adenylyl-sulfate reductase subunit alpha [Bacteroidetes bacterium]|nr:adenylyl-sulfate reductase subunit alpha [Bacteroidota bacterium]MBL6964527.1 adenylyl-sulfate reductase subunit alpha [Bacteroidota bacterium]
MSIREQFETVEITTDLLILGGGMSACGAAFEAAHWAKENKLKVTVVDKAAMDRSGAVAMGLSAINMYLGLKDDQNSIEDYVKYVKNDLMGITRDDLVANIARHVDGSVHLFEKWGLPIWKDDDGNYVREGRWQVMIHGESYKTIVAEAAKKALEELGENGEYFERVFITNPIMDGNRVAGAIGFSVRENKIYIFRAKAVISAMGGAVHVFKPRNVGEGLGRSWYPPFNSGASTYFTTKAGAEMTCQEVRFVPIRFKDGYGPVGAWYLLFKAKSTNAEGEDYMEMNRAELENWGVYGKSQPLPTNLRNHLMLIDERKGKGPFYMQTAEAIKKIAEEEGDEMAAKRKLKHLENEAWEDFLDMTISQALLWASTDVAPEEKPSEIGATEPYFISSHSGASGAWVSGPKDISPEEYHWGYANMTTVSGLFACGDASGASSHKFSSGSFTEGRIAGKSAIDFILDNKQLPSVDTSKIEEMTDEMLLPMALFEQHKSHSTDRDINPHFIKPKMFMFRLQKIMDEYAGGAGSSFMTSKKLMEKGLEFLKYMQEDSHKLAAESLHELMRVWENIHRLYQAESHIHSMLFREETRWPGYYFRTDFPKLNEGEWKCYVNSRRDPETGEYSVFKKEMIELVKLEE